MFSYLKQLILFILFFISFHFAYNYIKNLFLNKKKDPEVFEPTKYNSVLNEINELLEKKNNDDPTIDSSLNKNESENIEIQSLEEELANYMKETEKKVLSKNEGVEIVEIVECIDGIEEVKNTTSLVNDPVDQIEQTTL